MKLGNENKNGERMTNLRTTQKVKLNNLVTGLMEMKGDVTKNDSKTFSIVE